MNRRFFLVITTAFVIATLFLFTPVYSFYSDKHPVLEQIRERFTVLDSKFGEIPLRVGERSFTEDKTVITLCIVNPHTNKFYDINTLMYVGLHELAHTLTKADGPDSHGDEFKRNFAKLLKLAQEKGIYDATQPIPTSYCGTDGS